MPVKKVDVRSCMFDDVGAGSTPTKDKTWIQKHMPRVTRHAQTKTMPDQDELGVLHVSYAKLDQLDLGDMKNWIVKPLPKEIGVVQCYVKVPLVYNREVSLFLQDSHEKVMTGKKKKQIPCCSCVCPRYYSQYEIKMPSGEEVGEIRAKSSTVVQSNNFEIFAPKINSPESPPASQQAPTAQTMADREAVGLVHYKETCETVCCCDTWASLCLCCDVFLAPRKMQISMPSANNESGTSFRAKAKKNRPTFRHKMINMPPVWDEDSQAHVLDFRGRVTRTSQNNFQLVERSLLDKTARVQFGLVSSSSTSEEEIFTLDFMHPFSPLQAFSLALTSLDRGCDTST